MMSAAEIRKAVDSLSLEADRCDVEVGTDSTGDDAVWVYVVVRDSDADKFMAPKTWDRMREQIRRKVADVAGSGVITYVRLRTLSELEKKPAVAR